MNKNDCEFQQKCQGCALAEPGGPWRLTFAPAQLENLRFFIQIICWAPQILQFQSTGLPSIFLRAQPCIYVIIVCWEDIYSHYSIQSSNNDYFYP